VFPAFTLVAFGTHFPARSNRPGSTHFAIEPSLTLLSLWPSLAAVAGWPGQPITAGRPWFTLKADRPAGPSLTSVTFVTFIALGAGRAGWTVVAGRSVHSVPPSGSSLAGQTPFADRAGIAPSTFGTGGTGIARSALGTGRASFPTRAGQSVFQHRESRAHLLILRSAERHLIGAEFSEDLARLRLHELELAPPFSPQFDDGMAARLTQGFN